MPNTKLERVERFTANAVGSVLLLVAVSLWAWGIRLGAAAWRAATAWPPGLNELLLPVAVTSLLVGFGAWRILRIGLPASVGGLRLESVLLLLFAAATLAGMLA